MVLVLPLLFTLLIAQAPTTTPNPPDPTLKPRPAPSAKPVPKPNRIQLDVVVDDAAGKPLTGLQPWDFKLLDNDHPTKILYFRAFDGVTAKPDPPVEVILLLDLLNLSPQSAAYARDALRQFLTQNDGHLAQPTTLMVLSDKGLQVQPRPSRDGNAIAAVLNAVGSTISSINPAMGTQGAIDRFNRSLRQIRYIAENESHKPGRKLLVWVGTGWPMLESQHFVPGPNDQRNYFQAIVELSRWLRQAQMSVYSVSPNDVGAGSTGRELFYQSFTRPVVFAKQAESGNLALRVLAVESGGQVLGPSNDLLGQIRQCVANGESFYQLTFEPPPAQHADEYHSLKVTVTPPGALVRTTNGYYDQPPTP